MEVGLDEDGDGSFVRFSLLRQGLTVYCVELHHIVTEQHRQLYYTPTDVPWMWKQYNSLPSGHVHFHLTCSAH